MKNTITIYVSDSGIRSENVRQDEAESHIAARGAFAAESVALVAFIDADGIPDSFTDADGDVWNLVDSGTHNVDSEFYEYQLQ